MRIFGSVALVTGAARGIGRAITDALMNQGAKVCVADANKTYLDDSIGQLTDKYGPQTCIGVQCDVTDHDQMSEVFSQAKKDLGGLDMVVNNAGVIDLKNWKKTVNVNLNGTISGTLLGLEHMAKNQGGSGGVIVNIASISGMTVHYHNPIYSATKHGVIGLSRSLAHPRHFQETGVRINCVCPWTVRTDMTKQDLATSDTEGNYYYFPQEIEHIIKKLDQKGQFIEPQSIADATLKLIQEDHLNGEALIVNQRSSFSYAKFTEYKPFQEEKNAEQDHWAPF